MKCTHCHEDNKTNAKYCRYCAYDFPKLQNAFSKKTESIRANKKWLLTILVLFIGLNLTQGQENKGICYPDGLYKTKEDFTSKKPSEIRELTIKEIKLVNDTESIIERCYFSDAETNKRIKKVFAVCYKGQLYFSNWAILKNKNKDDKSLSPASSMNAFVLVIMYGEKYLYTEAGLVNHWQSGLSAGVAGGVGG